MTNGYVTGITFYGSKPTYPSHGDAYYDTKQNKTLVYDGTNWIEIIAKANNEDSKVKELRKEINDLKDYMKYKELNMEDFDDFITSKRVIEKLSDIC